MIKRCDKCEQIGWVWRCERCLYWFCQSCSPYINHGCEGEEISES